ncbi:unnamed protein product [Umbelopsis ramanniana]
MDIMVTMVGIITFMLVEAITTVASTEAMSVMSASMEVMTEGLRQQVEAVEASNNCRASKPNLLKHSLSESMST